MTPQPPPPIGEWPERPVYFNYDDDPPYTFVDSHGVTHRGSYDAMTMMYERAMKEAYAQRLRVAVEALRKYESIVVMYQDAETVCGRSFAHEALALIGPLPPETAKGE